MSKASRNHYGVAIASGGLLACAVEIARYWWLGTTINPWVMGTAAVLAFVGGAIIDTVKALQIGNAVVTGAVTVIGALPFGRRQTDKIANAGGTVVIPPTDEHAIHSQEKPDDA